jgi:hypothetical protein
MTERQDDPLVRALSSLPTVHQDDARAERVRAACRARLKRHASEPAAARLLEPATLATVCALYAWHIVRAVVR